MKKTLAYLLLLSISSSCAPESDSTDFASQKADTSNLRKNVASKPAPYQINNGMFVRNVDNGKIYIMFELRRRYIESSMTLYGLFKNPTIYDYNTSELSFTIEGAPLKADNSLIVESSTGRVFLREGNVIRYIPSMDIYNLYKFNDNAKTYVSSISNYTIGTNVGTTAY